MRDLRQLDVPIIKEKYQNVDLNLINIIIGNDGNLWMVFTHACSHQKKKKNEK